jgi:MFS family permease
MGKRRAGQWGLSCAPVRHLLVDISPLRDSAHYRRLWFNDLLSAAASQVAVVAVPYQVYAQTGSSLLVGLIGLAALIPLLAGAVTAGAIADAFDRRRLLVGSQLIAALCSLALALLAASGEPPLVPLYVLVAVGAFASAIESPVRNAVVPSLVGLERMPAAAALNQTVDQLSAIAGPAFAGLLLAAVGLTATYAVGAAVFGAALLTATRLPSMRPHGGGATPGLRAVVDGLRFARSRPALLSTFAIDLNAMIFGMPRALFPALAKNTFRVGPAGLGLLYAAPAVGALIAAVASGWVGRVNRQGLAVIASVIVWGASIAVFGLIPGDLFGVALVLLAVAGAADVISAVFRNTIMQQEAPDRMRGRMASLHIAVVTGGPRLGDLESGAVARLTTVETSVVSGGLICIAGVAVLHLISPALARYTRGSEVGPILPQPGDATVALDEDGQERDRSQTPSPD